MAAPEGEDPFAHTRMTLGEHLGELRKRLVRGLATVLVTFVIALGFHERITAIVLLPHFRSVALLNEEYLAQARALVAQDPALHERYFEPDGSFRLRIDERLEFLGPTEAMWFVFKVCGYFALFAGSPVLLWQLWQFVAAGLYEREKRLVRRFFAPALVLFLVGVLFSYAVLVPYGTFYLLKSVPIDLVKPSIRLEFYFSFLTTLSFGMGLVFQLPMLVTFLGTLGIVEPATFARLRGYFVLAAFVVAAFLTPGPDLFSQLAMALPMLGLYEIGIVGARIGARRRAAALASEVGPA
jgi:sec-independent protein translocase protein TatC